MNHEVTNGRSLASVLADMKEELKEFVATRIALLKSELREKGQTMKAVLPLALVGLVCLATGYLLFVATLVALVIALLPAGPYRWCLALFSIAVLSWIVGVVVVYLAKQKFDAQGLIPQKTIGVLKGDRLWIQSEVKQV